MSELKGTKIIIEGVTEDGEIFRPSDWADRISGSLSTFKNQRIFYSPLLQPSVQAGNRCVVLDERMKQTNPDLYQQILSFARTNRLRMSDEDGVLIPREQEKKNDEES